MENRLICIGMISLAAGRLPYGSINWFNTSFWGEGGGGREGGGGAAKFGKEASNRFAGVPAVKFLPFQSSLS